MKNIKERQEFNKKLKNAVNLRKTKKYSKAEKVLKVLVKSNPKNPLGHYHLAWTFDVQGKEHKAVSHYVKALKNGLSGDDRKSAYLGLGSTYRCLGKYKRSEATLKLGIKEFPKFRALQVFLALTKFNRKRKSEALSDLLNLLLDTTSDKSIQMYDRALRFYSKRVDRVWK